MSTSQAFITPAASGSSISASSRCSSVAYSCLRSLANPTARCSVSSRLRENEGKGDLSILFHGALKRVLMTPGRIDHLSHLGLRHFVGEYAAHPHTVLVDMQHDPGRILTRLVEEAF